MIISGTFAVKKVSEGSKNQFAFVLLLFTILFGIAYVGFAFSNTFRKKIVLSEKSYYFYNFYAFQTFFYLQYISAL